MKSRGDGGRSYMLDCFPLQWGYTLQVLGQKYAPPTDATILLSMEAVFAALTGFIFLGETMQIVQLVGCGLILLAVIVTQLNASKAIGSAV